MTEGSIIIYGTWWCGDCSRVRRFFDSNKINYQWVDIDKDNQGESYVLLTNRGMRSVPTILFHDGSTLTEPSDAELLEKIKSYFPEYQLS